MAWEGSLAGVRYRRSRRADVAALASLMELSDAVGEGLPTPSVFGIFTERDFAALIETAMICVTAVRESFDTCTSAAGEEDGDEYTEHAAKEVVVGFLALDDSPSDRTASATGKADRRGSAVDAPDFVQTTMRAFAATEKARRVTLSNSLWLRMLLAPASDVMPASHEQHHHSSNAGFFSGYSSEDMSLDLLRVTLGSLSGVEHIFMALGGAFAALDHLPGMSTLPSSATSSSADNKGGTAVPSVRHVARASVLPALTMRQGRVEDYDDAVTLLVAGGPGLITELPAQFYLEELLQGQDAQHKVVVAEDSVTHAVVGLACVRQLALEEQQYLARFYNTDTLERLKPVNVDGSEAAHTRQYQDGRTPSGTASIFFLYFNPQFEHSAYQLLPAIFREFPTCDYATLQRAHTQTLPEPMVLERFQYMPLRRYQPHNARGEVAPPPDALWVCPRVSLEAELGMHAQVRLLSDPAFAEMRAAVLAQFGPPRAASPAGPGVHAVLHHQQSRGGSGGGAGGNGGGGGGGGAHTAYPGCSSELINALREDLGVEAPGVQRHGKNPAAGPVASRAVFALSWGLPLADAPPPPPSSSSSSALPGRTVVGLLSVQPLSMSEVYALRANYDLDRFLAFNTAGGFNYAATDIAATAEEGPLSYRSSELPGLAIRFVYIRPAFRHHLKFFLREVLRQTRAAVLLNLCSGDATLCQTALSALVYVPPRRVVEVNTAAPPPAKGTDITTNYADGVDGATRLTDGVPEVNDVTPALSRVASKSKAKESAVAALALSSLFFTTRRHLTDEKVRLHPRVVIVGASATALSMLYELVSVPYVDLLNITLIATDGVPPHPNQAIGDSVASRSRQQQLWQADALELLEREYMRLRLADGFHSAASLNIGANVVRVVQGTLMDIDTSLKFVQLENGVYEPYDHLLLAPGRQYIVPLPIRALQQQEARSARGGVLALSGILAEDKLRHALAEMTHGNAASIANVVVYGSGLDAIATVSTIISLGFPAQRLVLCRPQTGEAVAGAGGGAFVDPACGDAVMALFRVLGVTVLDGYGVSRLEFDDDVLSSVLLASLSYERRAGDAVELPCSLLVCLEDKDIDANVLTALTKRSIVFDGRVIVGTTYETSQPDVLAAGPVAMFTRRYGATESFEAYSARDVGRDVAHVLLGRLGVEEFHRREDEGTKRNTAGGAAAGAAGTFDDAAGAQSAAFTSSFQAGQPHASLPSYTSPVARRVRLPCNYHYFSAVRGAALFRADECIRLDYSSADMMAVSLDDVQMGVAPNTEADKKSVREMLIVFIHRRHRTIDGVVYLGNGSPLVHNYRALVGLPESLFHVEFRYKEALAAADSAAASSGPGALTVSTRNGRLDLVAYLSLPLFHPLLTDHFAAFFAHLRKEMADAEDVAAARERVVRAGQAAGSLTAADAAAQVAELTDTRKSFRYKVQLALLKFLHEGKDRRPQTMYLPNIEKQVAMTRSSG